MELGLKDKVAIVTGSGRGIGRAIALALAREGAAVVVNDIGAEVARDVAEEIRALGSRALDIKADVTDAAQVNEMVKKTMDEFGRVDVLVNNAGIVYVEDGPVRRRPLFVDSTPEGWQKEVGVVLFGTLNCTKAVLDHMIRQNSGRIVNIASTAALYGAQRRSIYAASKGAIVAFTMNLASEVGDYNITVNAVAPGTVEATRLSTMKNEAPAAWDERLKRVLSMTALPRSGEPEDVAKAVVFIASDAASWITGQTLRVDGGKPIIRRSQSWITG
jgi:3-oxoacyl-[acyl-carrier protein] reductase